MLPFSKLCRNEAEVCEILYIPDGIFDPSERSRGLNSYFSVNSGPLRETNAGGKRRATVTDNS